MREKCDAGGLVFAAEQIASAASSASGNRSGRFPTMLFTATDRSLKQFIKMNQPPQTAAANAANSLLGPTWAQQTGPVAASDYGI